jgi:phosphoribosyl 1,2-cyclic phosphodiesterase
MALILARQTEKLGAETPAGAGPEPCCSTAGPAAPQPPPGDGLEVVILGSGSSGNALLVRSGSCQLLVDAGLSARRLMQRLVAVECAPGELSGILLTHEHGDHAGGLKVFCRQHQVPLFANKLTAEAVRFQHKLKDAPWRYFQTGEAFALEEFSVQPFSVPHDAADPVGFVLAAGGVRFAVVTDLGMVTQSVVQWVRGVDTVFVETNYDEALLEADTKRPWPTKQRIASRHGHLSNRAAAQLIVEIATPQLQTVILGHLSQDCNSPERACLEVREALAQAGHAGVRVICAERDAMSEPLRLHPGPR